MKKSILFLFPLLLSAWSPRASGDEPIPAPSFGYNAKKIQQLEANAWLVREPYYFNGSNQYLIAALPGTKKSDSVHNNVDQAICQKVGFKQARLNSRIESFPGIDGSHFAAVILNFAGQIVSVYDDLQVGDLPSAVFWQELVCER